MSQLNHPNPSPSSADVSKVPKKNDGADSSLQSSDKKDNLDKAKPHAIKSADDQQKGPSIEGEGTFHLFKLFNFGHILLFPLWSVFSVGGHLFLVLTCGPLFNYLIYSTGALLIPPSVPPTHSPP